MIKLQLLFLKKFVSVACLVLCGDGFFLAWGSFLTGFKLLDSSVLTGSPFSFDCFSSFSLSCSPSLSVQLSITYSLDVTVTTKNNINRQPLQALQNSRTCDFSFFLTFIVWTYFCCLKGTDLRPESKSGDLVGISVNSRVAFSLITLCW